LLGDPKKFSPVLEPYLGGPGRRMFENGMPMKLFVRGRDNIPGEWRKLRNEGLRNLYYYPPNIGRVIS